MAVHSFHRNRVGHLQFANPKRHNALTQEDWLSVQHHLDELVAQQCRAILIYGEGASFCAGADISEFDTVRKDAKTARIYENSNIAAFTALRSCPVPTLAAIDTYCLGGGFGLAAACDLRLATPRAQFAVPAAKLGLAYPVEAINDIAQAIGLQNAKAMLFTAKRYTAQEMKEMGFLLDIVEPQDLINEVESMAGEIAQLAPLTHRATKASLVGISQAVKEQADLTFESEDYAEGRAAFAQKRKPVFKGQ